MNPRDHIAARLGYVRADEPHVMHPEPLPDPGTPTEPVYPAVIIVQGRPAGESWVRDHAGQIMLAAGVGVFALTALVVVALVVVVVVVALAILGLSAAVLGVAAASAGSSGKPSRGRRR